MNISIIAKIIGVLMIFLALFGLIPQTVAWMNEEPLFPWYWMNGTAMVVGLMLCLAGWRSRPGDMGPREGIAVTTLAWLFASLVSSVGIVLAAPGTPYLYAWFEAMSGFTTTGASIFGSHVVDGTQQGTLIVDLTDGLKIWRSLMQWMGGLGIVVFSLALIPLVLGGSAGFQMYRAEVPGLSADRLAPRLASTARILLGFYVGLTAAMAIALLLCGVELFDAINHACTTIASGGYSTYDDSVEGLESVAAEWAIIVGMLMAGINFSLLITALRGRFGRLWHNTEARVYLQVIFGFTALSIALLLYHPSPYHDNGSNIAWHDCIRDALFQITSITTSTGYVVGYDTHPEAYGAWPNGIQFILIMLMIVGGCAGSTAGGAKMVRMIVGWRACRRELRRFTEPARVTPVTLDGHPVTDRVVLQATAYLLIYLFSWQAGAATLAVLGNDLHVAKSAAVSCLSNIGPAIGDVGPASNFRSLDQPSILVCIFLMLLGRLELFGVLMTLRPRHWRK